MTETIGYFAQSRMGRTPFDPLIDSIDRDWEQEQQYLNPMAMLTAGWAQPPVPHMNGGQQALDTRFDQPDQSYFQQPRHIPSPHVYPGSDMGTPSSHGYQDPIETYPGPQMSLVPPHHPHHHQHIPGSMHSPHSSISAMSPYQAPLASPPTAFDVQPPPFPRLNSAPEPRDIAKATASAKSGKHKGATNSDNGSDEDYPPDATSRRGRKRQRIPHTAVERRYRENLNAHLEKLRQTVPSLAARKGSGGKVEGGEGVKPSKCEVLHGAIEYIGMQEKALAGKDARIAELAGENARLEAALEQMREWIRGNYR